MGEANAYRIDTHEPVTEESTASPMGGYETPFERANSWFDQAQQSVVQLGTTGMMDPKLAAQLQYQAAQFEMLTAIHQAVEQIERNTRQVSGAAQ